MVNYLAICKHTSTLNFIIVSPIFSFELEMMFWLLVTYTKNLEHKEYYDETECHLIN